MEGFDYYMVALGDLGSGVRTEIWSGILIVVVIRHLSAFGNIHIVLQKDLMLLSVNLKIILKNKQLKIKNKLLVF